MSMMGAGMFPSMANKDLADTVKDLRWERALEKPARPYPQASV